MTVTLWLHKCAIHLSRADWRFSSMATTAYERSGPPDLLLIKTLHTPAPDHCCGARESVAADRLVSARPESRQTTDLTDPWRREGQSNALNWQPGAAAFSGDRKNEQRYTAYTFGPRQGRSTDRTERPWCALVLTGMGEGTPSRKPSGCPIAQNKKEPA